MDIETFTKNFIGQGIRPDGRGFEESRTTTVNVKSIRQADGSSIVRLGKTTVICGVKAELAKPKAETPNEGFLIINIDLPPLCSPSCPPGPPCDEAQTATAFISRALLSTNAVDLKSLCIVPDKLAWVLYLDIVCLNLDGGLLEAAVCAATSSLLNTTLPKVNFDVETGVKTVAPERSPLKVNATPFATTFAVFEDAIMQDPTAEEEVLATGLVTTLVCMEAESSQPLHMSGCRPLTPSELIKCLELSQHRARQLNKVVQISNESPER